MSNTKDLTRRKFFADAGRATLGAMLAASTPLIVPSRVLGRDGRAPSDKVNVAIVGCGGMGIQNALVLAQSDHIGAVCDVDFAYSERCVASTLTDPQHQPRPDGRRLLEQFTKAKRYTDFREMLAREKTIDGVLIATPDHLHAVIAKAAMDLGKHVYVQKPLTATVHEARMLRALSLDNPSIVTQMGNQGHSKEGARLVNEWIGADILGPVREVHVWTNRPVVYWPQGLPRPTGLAPVEALGGFGNLWTYSHVQDVLAATMGSGGAPPAGLDWDLYLGPHLIDHPFWALELGLPASIEATSTQWGTTLGHRPVSYPVATCVHYGFAARGARPAVKLSWFDGGIYPPRPDLLPDDVELKSEGGAIFIGDKGILLHDTYGANPRLYPENLAQAAAAVPKSIPRILWSHELNWTKAIRGEAKASSPFDYAARLTETMLLGVVALRAGQGKKILYDGEEGRVTNMSGANQYLTREYRAGWQI